MYKVAVVRGGPSDEHDVSMRTGAAVLSAIANSEFEPLDIVISRAGEWLQSGRVWNPVNLLQSTDVVFNALHGAYGEDGTIQRYLDLHGIAYTGSKAFPSSVAINKALTKDYLRQSGIKLAPHLFAAKDTVSNPHQFAAATADVFDGPYVLKPVSGGSSVGTVIAKNTIELGQLLETLFIDYDQILVEKKLEGREATVGIVNNFRDQHTYILPPIEIVPRQGFFDYQAKYDGTTEEICPGRFDFESKQALMNAAQIAHTQLGLSQYSRSDFILTKDGPYFLEINTLPDLTQASLVPKALDAVGVSFSAFIKHLLYDALKHAPK